jgi:hypothetical protein
MPKSNTKKPIGIIIDPELEKDLDDESLATQLTMLNQLHERNKLNKTTTAVFNYLKELSRQRNETWKQVKSPRTEKKRISFGENKTKEFFKALPANISTKPPKLKRSQTYGGKRNTRKNRTQKHRK